MTIMGIDPSLNHTGLAWQTQDGEIETTAIPVKKLKRSSRLSYVKDVMIGYLDEVDPSVIIYEDYAFGAKGAAIFQIGELGGVLKTLCYERGLDVILVPPSTLKLFCAGKGNADKDDMMIAINDRWNRYFSCSDQADAYALLRLGETFLDQRKTRACSTKVKESFAKVEHINGKLET